MASNDEVALEDVRQLQASMQFILHQKVGYYDGND